MSAMNCMPKIGEIFSDGYYRIQIIDKEDFKNKDESGNYRRTGKIIYEYLSHPIGKIGNCKTLEGFNATWR